MQHRFLDTNGIRIHYVESGTGPLVLLCHGFPECWYSWRSQIDALASAGFRVIAPDQRGYGRTSTPEDVAQYTVCHLTGDIVGLLQSLNQGPAAIVGHDWGAVVAWTSALLRPDLFPSLALLRVPYLPRMMDGRRPTGLMKAMCGDSKMFYQLYFQEPGAESELEADVRGSLTRIFVGASGDRAPSSLKGFLFDRGQRWIDTFPNPEKLPSWLTEADLDVFTEHFTASGFRGPLNWYRNMDRNSELLAALAGRRIEQPSLFVAGERDGVIRMYRDAYDRLESSMPGLTAKHLIPGAGHWVQQERPEAVNALLLEFLRNTQAGAVAAT